MTSKYITQALNRAAKGFRVEYQKNGKWFLVAPTGKRLPMISAGAAKAAYLRSAA